MSDNKNISIQDRGWKEMQSLLDRELPTEKKKRKFLPWFILGAVAIFIIVFAGISGSLYLKSKSDTIATVENTNKSNPSLESIEEGNKYNSKRTPTKEYNGISETSNLKGSADQELEKDIRKPVKTDIVELKTSSVDIEADNRSANENKIASKLIKSDVQTLAKASIESTFLNNIDEGLVERNPEELNPNINSESINQTYVKDESNLSAGFTNGAKNEELDFQKEHSADELVVPSIENQLRSDQGRENIPFIPLIQKLPIEIPFLNLEEKGIQDNGIKPIVFAQNRTSLSPYAYVAGSFNSNINGFGYDFGAGLDYKINNFDIYFEVGYSKTSFNNGEIAESFSPSGIVTELDDNVKQDEGLEANVSEFDLSLDNFSKITASLKEIKFNLGMKRSLSKRLNVDFGLTYSRVLSVTNKSLAISLEIENSFNEIYSINVTSSELYDNGAYASYDVIPHIGLEYNFFKSAYLGLNYNYGLKNLIAKTSLNQITSNATSETIDRRNIEVKLRFLF